MSKYHVSVAPPSTATTIPAVAVARRGQAAPEQPAKAVEPFHLEQELKESMAKLEAAGVPRWAVDAVIKMQLRREFGMRREKLLARDEFVSYWKPKPVGAYDPNLLQSLRDLSREESDALRRLLGADSNVEVGNNANPIVARLFGNVSRDTAQQIQAIVSDYSDMKAALTASFNGVVLPEDRAKLALLDREQESDLAKILTPEQLEQFELRSSATASKLRSELAIMNPTEEEFLKIFRLQKAFDDTSPGPGEISTKAENAKRLEDDLKKTLGPERYADYTLATNPSNQGSNRLIGRFGLPLQVAADALNIQQEALQQAQNLAANRTLTSAERNNQIGVISDVARNRLRATLGSDAYGPYMTINSGFFQRLRMAGGGGPSSSPRPKG